MFSLCKGVGAERRIRRESKGRRGEEGQNEDSMGPTAERIRISFPSPSGCVVGVGFIWVDYKAPKHQSTIWCGPHFGRVHRIFTTAFWHQLSLEPLTSFKITLFVSDVMSSIKSCSVGRMVNVYLDQSFDAGSQPFRGQFAFIEYSLCC